SKPVSRHTSSPNGHSGGTPRGSSSPAPTHSGTTPTCEERSPTTPGNWPGTSTPEDRPPTETLSPARSGAHPPTQALSLSSIEPAHDSCNLLTVVGTNDREQRSAVCLGWHLAALPMSRARRSDVAFVTAITERDCPGQPGGRRVRAERRFGTLDQGGGGPLDGRADCPFRGCSWRTGITTYELR